MYPDPVRVASDTQTQKDRYIQTQRHTHTDIHTTHTHTYRQTHRYRRTKTHDLQHMFVAVFPIYAFRFNRNNISVTTNTLQSTSIPLVLILIRIKTRTVEGGCLRPLACCNCGFETHRRQAYLYVLIVVYCQVEVSATGRSLVQRSPTERARACVSPGATVTIYTDNKWKEDG
jgi:hypothetical protein